MFVLHFALFCLSIAKYRKLCAGGSIKRSSRIPNHCDRTLKWSAMQVAKGKIERWRKCWVVFCSGCSWNNNAKSKPFGFTLKGQWSFTNHSWLMTHVYLEPIGKCTLELKDFQPLNPMLVHCGPENWELTYKIANIFCSFIGNSSCYFVTDGLKLLLLRLLIRMPFFEYPHFQISENVYIT